MPTPEELMSTLDPAPVVLLPVRLETRFPPDQRELRIRIYPDQVHLDAHRPALSAGEIDAGRAYWRSRWAGAAEAAWADLTRGIRPPRARWIVAANAPTNLDLLGDPAGPTFGEPERADSSMGTIARVAALPGQWLAIGYQGGVEVVRAHGKAVAGDLAVGFLDVDAPEATAERPPLAEDATWIADYQRALDVGMAITVPADAFGGAGFDAGLDLLVVLGVVSGATESNASLLDAVLAGHSFSDGLGLLAAGVATNDTTTTRPTPTRPTVGDPAADDAKAGSRLRADLGLAAGGALDALTLTGTTGPVDPAVIDRVAGAMVDALWSATLGYALDQLFTPTVGRADAGAARRHARDHLRPGGHHPCVQVGRQPYGVLPVVAPGHLVPTAPPELTRVLRLLRPVWSAAAARVPRLSPGAPAVDGDVDSTFATLLRLAPASTRYRYRTVLGPMLAANTAGLAGAAGLQTEVRRLVFTNVLEVADPPRVAEFVASPRHWPLRMPLVAPSADEPDPGTLTEIARIGRQPDARAQLAARQPASLLEALVTLAAIHEIDIAVAALAGRHAPPSSPLARLAWRTPELPGVTAASAPSPRRLAELVLPGATEDLGRTVSDLLAAAESGVDRDDVDVVDGLLALVRAVDTMSGTDTGVLESALTGFLDACSHRLDAWFTSLAAAQLAAVRQDRPSGTHVGAYAWVEGVHPDTRPDPSGYLLGPSLAHASAAAILRSGYETHRGEGDGAFDVDLTSRRAEEALELLRAVNAGIGVGQLLGYHFERALHDAGLQRLVPAMRSVAPLHPGPGMSTVADVPPEDPDTVDGETLLGRRAQAMAVIAGESADVVAAVEAALDRLADRFDAAGDLATAESVYQLVLGRPERVRAALGLLDRQDQVPEPEIGQTPQDGIGVVHRVVVALEATAPAAGWEGIPRSTPATAEPRVDGWIGQLLGRPEQWRFTGVARGPGGEMLATSIVDLRRLGLTPLPLVLAVATPSTGGPTAFEHRLARVLADELPPLAPDSTLELAALTPGALGLGEFLAHAGAIRAALERCRPGDANAFGRPDTVVDSGIDVAELTARADSATAAFVAAHERLVATLAAPSLTRAAIRDALDAAADAGMSGAGPPFELVRASGTGPRDEIPAAALVALARSTAAAMAATGERLAAIDAGPPPSSATEAVARQRQRLELIVGAAMPILPTFILDVESTADLQASVADQADLTNDDSLVALTWFTRTSRVRAPVGALWRALTGAEAVTGGFTPDQVVVAQRPHLAGRRWIGAEQELDGTDGTDDIDGTTGIEGIDMSLVIVAPSGVAAMTAGAPFGSIVVDGWSERIPSAVQSAGLAFQYDAPGNRAPQAWLVAVPPDPAATTWTAEQLVDTVLEAVDLTRVRAVTLADIPTAAPLLPAIYLPTTFGPEVAGVDLHRWVPAGTMVVGRD